MSSDEGSPDTDNVHHRLSVWTDDAASKLTLNFAATRSPYEGVPTQQPLFKRASATRSYEQTYTAPRGDYVKLAAADLDAGALIRRFTASEEPPKISGMERDYMERFQLLIPRAGLVTVALFTQTIHFNRLSKEIGLMLGQASVSNRIKPGRFVTNR